LYWERKGPPCIKVGERQGFVFVYPFFLSFFLSFFSEKMWTRATGCPTHYFSLVVVHDPKTDKLLAVEETKNRGWWLPGGFCECGDDLVSTAHKETLEEGGMKIKLMGILHIQSSISSHSGRMRVIFYAQPLDENQKEKTVADEESVSSKWLSLDELRVLNQRPPPKGLRGDELLVYGQYLLEEKGLVYPLSLLAMSEHEKPTVDTLVDIRRRE
jgi:phosphatase NudJ